jgi:hypothetical protein
MAPGSAHTIYAGTPGGVFKLADGQVQQKEGGMPSRSVWWLAIFFGVLILISAWALAAGWTPANNGLPRLSLDVNALAVDPASSGTIYAQTDSYTAGLFKSTDGAASWHPLPSIEKRYF